jgi:hypothetical protein
MPLAHAADPASQHAPIVIVSLADHNLRFDQPVMAPGAVVYVDGWVLSAPQDSPTKKALASHRFHWTIA